MGKIKIAGSLTRVLWKINYMLLEKKKKKSKLPRIQLHMSNFRYFPHPFAEEV